MARIRLKGVSLHLLEFTVNFQLCSEEVSLSIVLCQLLPMLFFGFEEVLPLGGVELVWNIIDLWLEGGWLMSELMDVIMSGAL